MSKWDRAGVCVSALLLFCILGLVLPGCPLPMPPDSLEPAAEETEEPPESEAEPEEAQECAFGEAVNATGDCVPVCPFGVCPQGWDCNWDTRLCEEEEVDEGGSEEDVGDPCEPEPCESIWGCPEESLGPDCSSEADEFECGGPFDCGFGQVCDEGECVPLASTLIDTCEDNSDCPFLMTCQGGVCIGCIDDLMCPEGRCILGTCVLADLGPAGDCLGLTCSEGESCNLQTGVCEPVCETNADCPAGAWCNPLDNFCGPSFQCMSDSDCLTGSCIASICMGCTSNGDCPPGVGCVLGMCLPSASADLCTDATCSESEACDPLDGSCYPEDGTCSQDTDCRDDQSCSFFGVCSGCDVDGDCRPEQRCLFSSCVTF